MSLEQELRDTLRHAADELGTAQPAAGVRSAGMRVLVHRRRRRRATVLSAGLAVLVIAVGIPTGMSLVESADNEVAAPASTAEPTPEPPPSVDIFAGPTRGSLAGDLEFVEAVRQLLWGDPVYGPPVEARRVVFAGDVITRRYALVIGEMPGPSEGLSGGWFAGEAGATPDQMEFVKDIPISPDQPEALYHPVTGALVVLAAPGDRIEVSARPEVAADGTVFRNYVDTGSSDGVAAIVTQPATLTTVQYRVSRAGVVMEEHGPSMADDSDPPVYPQVEVDYLRQPVSDDVGQQRHDIQSRADGMLSDYGLRLDEATVQLQYYGPIFSLTTSSMSISVMTMSFPSGAVLTRAVDFAPGLWHEPECYIDNISPAGAPAAQRSIAIRCDVNVQGAESSLIVIAPTDYAGGYAVAEGSAGSVRVELDGEGVGMVAFPEGASGVTIFAPDGTAGDEVPILTA